MDWASLVKGCDISHYQLRPDFGKLEADGIKFIIIKATQGGGVDPDFEHNRDEAVRRNMLWLPYPFLLPTDNDASILHFCSVVGLGSKLPAALDWEKVGVSATVVERWMDICEDRLGRDGLCYHGIYPPDHPTPRIGRWPWWLAQYPKNWLNGPKAPAWGGNIVPTNWLSEWLVWQYTGHGRLLGITTEIDLNVLAVPLVQFEGWYRTGSWSDAARAPNDAAAPAETVPEVPLDRVLYLHCTGDDVLALQRRLQWLGEELNADGEYGPETMQAVRDFQMKHGLAADGIAGIRSTIPAINAAAPQ